MPNNSAEIVTFHGADGCGKTTIARSFAESLRSQREDVVVLGGSSYKDWLTPTIAKNALGKGHIISKPAQTAFEKTVLYEQIAVACYGYAGYLRDHDTHVVIDSDPVLKRFVWSRLEGCHNQGDGSYEQIFGAYVLRSLASSAFPGVVISVDAHDRDLSVNLRARLSRRGGNSEYDPTSKSEAAKLCEEVARIREELSLASEGASSIELFNARLGDVILLDVTNPDCNEADIEAQVKSTVMTIDSMLRDRLAS